MLALALADKWGYANPDAMLEAMSGQQWAEWKVYFGIQDEQRRDAELDARGKANLAKHMSR